VGGRRSASARAPRDPRAPEPPRAHAGHRETRTHRAVRRSRKVRRSGQRAFRAREGVSLASGPLHTHADQRAQESQTTRTPRASTHSPARSPLGGVRGPNGRCLQLPRLPFDGIRDSARQMTPPRSSRALWDRTSTRAPDAPARQLATGPR